MSRVGKKPISVPGSVKIDLTDNFIRVAGPKGKLEGNFHKNMKIEYDNQSNVIQVTRPDDTKENRSLHGLTRALINNMVTGVTTGFEKKLQIEGVGYNSRLEGNNLHLNLGYSHPIVMEIPKGIEVEVSRKGDEIIIKGYDKQLLGQFAANIREWREPEPYKGKGIRYSTETVRRKAGKRAK